jgi:uncharacterized protein
MEPQTNHPAPKPSQGAQERPPAGSEVFAERTSRAHDFSSIFLGDDGLRCGWSALVFIGLYYLLLPVFSIIAVSLDPALTEAEFAPIPVLVSELVPLAVILVGALFVSSIEHRHLVDYNLVDARMTRHFASGMLAGFAALSVLVGSLALGGWLRFGPAAMPAASAPEYAALWACAFLLIGTFEEGFFRCFLLSVLARGISFWWALATVSLLCLRLLTGHDLNGTSGVLAIGLIGVVPCWLVHRLKRKASSFWQAAWVTSTGFGYFHTHNGGENAIGIFAAGLIGFTFCVSVKLTGSAWWAIGCHAAWDWAETFFYGTLDSGFAAQHHLLTATPAGNALGSGGSDGPEGSVLVLPVILLLLVSVVFLYRVRPAPRLSIEQLPI